MKAAVRKKYGPPNIIKLTKMGKPIPKNNDIVVRVHAATVNRTDCGILWGKPFIIRFFTGLIRPKKLITGTDFAGEVTAIGKNATSFKIGDRFFGFDDNIVSSHAQYLCISEEKPILTIPDDIDYDQAAASLEGAHYAYNFINKVDIKSGQKVMINGATGAIGNAALQMLKDHGLYIAATCTTQNIDLIKSLGADKVIDYTTQDFTQDDEKYDFVFDAVGKSTFGKCKSILNEKGVYISSELGPWCQNPILALTTRLISKKKVKFPLPVDIKRSMKVIRNLLEKGEFKPVIDKKYPLEEISDAYNYVASEQKTGNVIITMD